MPLIATRGASSVQGFGQFAQATAVNYIEDMFSAYLWSGNSTNRSIVNNINLSGKGGLVWIKDRNAGLNHTLFDTARGATNYLFSDNTNAQDSAGNTLTAFNSTGFDLGTNSSYVNGSGYTYVGWTFRKQPKFFDVVTYTGNGTAGRTISHSLGSVPACIIVKDYANAGNNWKVYHRSLGGTKFLNLSATTAAGTDIAYWNNTDPTSTVFTVGDDSSVNGSGRSYVAYLFAHDAGGFGLTGTDNVISCGSYVGNGLTAGPQVTLGYEPQWVLRKNATAAAGGPTTGGVGAGAWSVVDNMRGMSQTTCPFLFANSAVLEDASTVTTGYIIPNATGFVDTYTRNGDTYIYIAIRRGPMKVPTDATKVFAPIARSGTGAAATVTGVGFTPDWWHITNRTTGGSQSVVDRLRGDTVRVRTNNTAIEDSLGTNPTFSTTMDGVQITVTGISFNQSGETYINYFFKRAPGFFDEVCYTGTGVARTLSHNLATVPEMMLVKIRGPADTGNWAIYHSFIGNTASMAFSTSGNINTSSGVWNNTTPTSSVFSIGTNNEVNINGQTYVAYLFATCAGVSKVGSYTGNGSSQTINCGFTAGARFILIKRVEVDVSGDWYVWDTARGIVSGNDSHLSLNSVAAEVTTDDTIDTNSTGFVVNQVAATNVNVSSTTYIFLAIA